MQLLIQLRRPARLQLRVERKDASAGGLLVAAHLKISAHIPGRMASHLLLNPKARQQLRLEEVRSVELRSELSSTFFLLQRNKAAAPECLLRTSCN